MENGKITISKDVIAIITDLAMSEAVTQEEVYRKVRNKGIDIAYEGDELVLTIDVVVQYGSKIPAVAEKIQKKVSYSVENMTGQTVKAVNVNISGMHFEK
ncbi:MAG: Asp23/Gls24 family envelope stress response protein [Lachnospiraceae bacterium]|nr:Asp23/Gls24 family envelope stress response protein [Lachnospiraceae bacterium]